MKKQAITRAQIERVMKAGSDCGQIVREVVMTPEAVRVIFEEGVDLPDSPEEACKPKEWPRSAL